MRQEYDKWRIGFRCLTNNHHLALIVETYINEINFKVKKKGRWEHDRNYGVLLESDIPCNIDSFLAWLNTFVEMIEVDGREFWVNQALINNEEGEYYGK